MPPVQFYKFVEICMREQFAALLLTALFIDIPQGVTSTTLVNVKSHIIKDLKGLN